MSQSSCERLEMVSMPRSISSLEDSTSVFYKRRAELFAKADIICVDDLALDMDAVRERLLEAVENSGLARREIARRAGVGPGYLTSLLREKKEPGIDRLSRICNVVGVSVAWVMHGYDISPSTEKIMARLQGHPDKHDGILKILGD